MDERIIRDERVAGEKKVGIDGAYAVRSWPCVRPAPRCVHGEETWSAFGNQEPFTH